MPIVSLSTPEASLVLEPVADGPPLWRHLGLRLASDGLIALADCRGPASFSLDEDVPLATAPTAGLGWFGPAAVELPGTVLRWQLERLGADDDGIHIRLADAGTGLVLAQRFMVANGGFVVDAALENRGARPLAGLVLASALLPLPAGLAHILSWRGRHAAEFAECREALPEQAWLREGRRGLPGHGGPPGLYLLGAAAGWHEGLVLAAQLAWSGDSRLLIERDDEGRHMLWAGAADAISLAPGQRHEAPPLLLAVSGRGRNGAGQQMHALVRSRLDWPGGAMAPRPIHLNSWEACYFRHDEARILELARAAAAVGAERFVLDDGWFRGRDHDRAGLGDWVADPRKYPHGLKPLAEAVRGLGLQFGLWVEPEMVNPDSDLYRAHPDWVLHVPGAPRPTARHQLVLNLALPAVEDHLFGALDRLLAEVPISYLKWDHNRDLAPAGGGGQVAGLYRLLARLRAAHPAVEIESCAGGGGRIDAGIAAFTHRFWTSDNLDPVSRIAIQRGFLSFFPPELMGAHVGASPAHVTGRTSAMAYRCAIALAGHMGVELDPARLAADEREELARWLALHRQWRHLLHGKTVVLGEGGDGIAWQASGDGREWLLLVCRSEPAQDRRQQPLPLKFLAGAGPIMVRCLAGAGLPGRHGLPPPAILGAMQGEGVRFPADWLAHAGLPLPPLLGQGAALFHLSA